MRARLLSMTKKILAGIVVLSVACLWGGTRSHGADTVEAKGIGRYQIASGVYGVSVVIGVNTVDRTQNGLFRIDTETGEVQEYRLMLVAGGGKKITLDSA